MGMVKSTIFLTGATGLLGSYLLKILLQNNHRVYCLARSKDNKTAKERVINILNFWDEKVFKKYKGNLIVVEGDITKKNLGITKKNIELLKKEINEIFHCAAVTQFNAPLKYLRRVNVEGTMHVLEIASETIKEGKLKKVNYVSTAFISGKYNGVFRETDFDLNQTFNNNYEQSKFEAENLVRKYMQETRISILIFRPSILVGNYSSGKTTEFKMFYEPLRLFSQEIIEKVPIDTRTILNLMPVDLASKAIYVLSKNINKNGVFHITHPNGFSIDYIINIAASFFNFKKPLYISLNKYFLSDYSTIIREILEVYVPYFNFHALFDSTATQAILKKYGFQYPSLDKYFLNRLFRFCAQKKFIKIKKRK